MRESLTKLKHEKAKEEKAAVQMENKLKEATKEIETKNGALKESIARETNLKTVVSKLKEEVKKLKEDRKEKYLQIVYLKKNMKKEKNERENKHKYQYYNCGYRTTTVPLLKKTFAKHARVRLNCEKIESRFCPMVDTTKCTRVVSSNFRMGGGLAGDSRQSREVKKLGFQMLKKRCFVKQNHCIG